MTDRFTECLVKKVPDSGDNLKKVFLITAIAAIAVLTIIAAAATKLYLILIITMAVIYAAYYLLKGMSIEYEYIFTNGELDIDKIIGQRKRQHLITLNAKQFDAFGKVDADTSEKPNATLFLCSDNTGKNEYFADLITEEYGETRIIFTPNEKIVAYIEEALPPILKYRKHNAG